jgi:hypothetical protein
MRKLPLILALGTLFASPAAAGPIELIEQERYYNRTVTDDSESEVISHESYVAPDFSPFITPGQTSSASDDLLTGSLDADGGSTGPSPEISTTERSYYRVVFDLAAPGIFDLDATLLAHDNYFFNLGIATLTLSVFDSGLGSFQPIYSAFSFDSEFVVVDERLSLVASRYQLEARTFGDGFWSSQDEPYTGSGEVNFSFTVPEPGSAVLLGSMLALLGAFRSRIRLLARAERA